MMHSAEQLNLEISQHDQFRAMYETSENRSEIDALNLRPGTTALFVCMICRKLSYDREGHNPISRRWDISCMLNSQSFEVDRLILQDGRVRQTKAFKEGSSE
jgi:hypothetical protein